MKKWLKPSIEGDRVRALASSHNLDLLTASILTRRELTAPEQIAFFLEDDERFLHNPFLLPDMETAVERVLAAATEGEKVLVCGDKDADGITATVLMVEALRSVGLEPEWRVPVGDEDYGLNPRVLKEKSAEDFTLVIAVDCGISDFAEIDLAGELGMDVLIFDHHTPREGDLPEACAVVNPKVSNEYPFGGLSAVAVASKFQWALCLAGTDVWREEIGLIHSGAAAGNADSLVVEAVRIRNLQEVGRIGVSSDEGEAGRQRFVRFIEGLPLFTYGKERQVPRISRFFGGAEVHVADIEPEVSRTFPGLRGRSIEELSGASRLARYFPNNDGPVNALANLMITLYSRKLSPTFDPWRRGLDLVALGTLADLMPLVNENRILVRLGLNRLNGSEGIRERRAALRELLIRQRLHEGRIGTTELAWQLCPLINASGRMGRADVGVRFFLADDASEIESLAGQLVALNKKRRILGDALWDRLRPAAYQSMEALDGRMSIVADDEAPRGITGILATRVQKTLGVTSVVIARRGETASGSVRCDADINALEWLEAMAPLFDNFGGHPQAGGFRIPSGRIHDLVVMSRKWIAAKSASPASFEPLMIDAELSHDEIVRLGPEGLEGIMERLEPYGEGFRPLTFLTRSVRVHRADLVGKPKNNHLKLLVSLGSAKWPALWWDGADQYGTVIQTDADVDLVYRVDRDRWRGAEAHRLTVLEATPCAS